MSDNKPVAIIDADSLDPDEVFAEGGTDALIKTVEDATAEFMAQQRDMENEDDRKAVYAFDKTSLAGSKTGVEKLRKTHTEKMRKTIEKINAEGKRFTEKVEELQEKVSAPLVKWKAAEKDRVDALNQRLEELKALAVIPEEGISSADLEGRLQDAAMLHGTGSNFDWQDFAELAQQTHDAVVEKLNSLVPVMRQREAEAAELAELRRKQAAAEKQAEDDRLRREGEARAQQQAAEAKAEAERIRKQNHENGINLIMSQVDGMTVQHSSVLQARIDLVKRTYADADWQEYANRARTAHDETLEKLGQELPKAQQREADEADRAAKAAADEQKRREDEAEKARAADKEHRGKINREALADLMKQTACTEQAGIAVLTAIAKGTIRHVRITY